MIAACRVDRRTHWGKVVRGCAVNCCWTEDRAQHSGCQSIHGLVGGPEIVDCACSGAGDSLCAYSVPWRLKHLSDE